jgi:hypothetical protein
MVPPPLHPAVARSEPGHGSLLLQQGAMPALPDMPRSFHGPAGPSIVPEGDPALLRRINTLRTAAERRGNPVPARNAAWVLGLLYLHGIAVNQDAGQAQAWFEKAAALGHPLAPAGLAWCHMEGCGSSADPNEAQVWIARLRRADPARADYLEWLLTRRLAPVEITPDSALAIQQRQRLVRASRGRNPHAQLELAMEEVAQGKTELALEGFRQAAPTPHAASANPSQQAPESDEIHSGGTPSTAQGQIELARRYHRGEGVPSNYAEAIRLYRLAASKGNKEATRMLDLIFSRMGPDGQIDSGWMRELAFVDVSTSVPRISGSTGVGGLHREATPLTDLVPPEWRAALGPTR